MRAAVVQLNSTGEKARNLEAAERLVRAAAADGAELVALPEKWNLLAGGEELLAGAEALDGPSLNAARAWARELGIHLLAGSISEQGPGEKAFNTSVLIGPDGEDLAVYRKIHMFDVEAGGVTYRESAHEEAGEEIVTAALNEITIGLSVCYDLRFPELFRILAVRGAEVLTVPSAFTLATGRDHWEVLLRARAIENQAFVARPQPGRCSAAALQIPTAARRSSTPGAWCWRPRPTRSASSPRSSTSSPRREFARRCPRSPIAAPVPTSGRS